MTARSEQRFITLKTFSLRSQVRPWDKTYSGFITTDPEGFQSDPKLGAIDQADGYHQNLIRFTLVVKYLSFRVDGILK